jgi:hypothetical protein
MGPSLIISLDLVFLMAPKLRLRRTRLILVDLLSVVSLLVFHFFCGGFQEGELILSFLQLLTRLILPTASSSCRLLGRTTLSKCLSSSTIMPGPYAACSRFLKGGVGYDPIIGENQGQPKNTSFLNPDNTSANITFTQGMFTSFISSCFLSYYINCRLCRLSRWRVLLCAFSFGNFEYHRCLSSLHDLQRSCVLSTIVIFKWILIFKWMNQTI